MSNQPRPRPRDEEINADTGLPATTPRPTGEELPPIRLMPGEQPIADFELISLLGRGGFGEVWKARGPGGFLVALKFIRLGDQASAVELRSLEFIKDQRHPHLLGNFGAWQRDGFLIVAMELGDGTLLNRLREAERSGTAGIPPAELLEYMREAAKGIDHLNNLGIQHRDIKPQNLLLLGGGVKVADFGLAKVLEHSMSSNSGAMTPAYAAPEFLNGQTSSRSDQYSLGVTYCQLRGGRLPFAGNPAQMMTGHLIHPPDLTMLPEAERPAVTRALSKSPDDRWPSCRAFVDALAVALGESSGHHPAPATREMAAASTTTTMPKSASSSAKPRRWSEATAPTPIPTSRTPLVLFVTAVLLIAGAAVAAWWKPWQTWELSSGGVAKVNSSETPKSSVTTENDKPSLPAPVVPLPRPKPHLRLIVPDALPIEPRKPAMLKVKVVRENCPGPIRIHSDITPAGVVVFESTIAGGTNEGELQVSLAPDFKLTGTALLISAVGEDNTRADELVRLVVKSPMPALPTVRLTLLAAPDRPRVGDRVTCTVEATNSSGQDLARLRLVGEVSKDAEVVLGQGAGFEIIDSTHFAFYGIAIKAGESMKRIVVVEAKQEGTAQIRLELHGEEFGDTPVTKETTLPVGKKSVIARPTPPGPGDNAKVPAEPPKKRPPEPPSKAPLAAPEPPNKGPAKPRQQISTRDGGKAIVAEDQAISVRRGSDSRELIRVATAIKAIDLQLSPNEQRLFALFAGKVECYDLATGKLVWRNVGIKDPHRLQLDRNGADVLVISKKGVVSVFDARTGAIPGAPSMIGD